MSNEKRGSEKLLNNDSDMCSLTADEIAQVGGMHSPRTGIVLPIPLPVPFPSFPEGQPDPLIFDRPDFRELSEIGGIRVIR